MTLDLREFLRPDDLIVWGQACAEPRLLTKMLVEQADRIPPVRCFTGIPVESNLAGHLPRELQVISYCGSGSNAALHRAGRLDILPVHYSTLPHLLTSGPLRADVVMAQVSPADAEGRHSLGLAEDYFSVCLRTARVVLAEINHHVPRTVGATTIAHEDITAWVESDQAPAELITSPADAVARAIGRHVAGIIEDEATLQLGIGALPSGVVAALGDHRRLGIHSGILSDAVVDLIESGVATGECKTLNRGVAIGGLLGGTARLFRFADDNPALQLRPTAYTHDPQVLGSSHLLTAINGALQVDLTGQVNAEEVAGRYVGAVGGAVDFVRGAHRSRGGVPIVVLPSQVRGRSTIVTRLDGPVSTPRSEPVVVVTEHGAADLRGATLRERAERLLAIAHPDHRTELDRAAEGALASA